MRVLRRGTENEFAKLCACKAAIAASYVLMAIAVEFATFSLLYGGFSLPEYIWIDLVPILIFGVLVFFVPSCIAGISIAGFLLLFQCIMCMINKSMIEFSGTVGTISYLSLLKDLGDMMNGSTARYDIIAALFVVWGACMGWMIFVWLSLRVRAPLSRHLLLLLLGCCSIVGQFLFVVQELAVSSLPQGNSRVSDDRYLYYYQINEARAYQKFGTYGFYCRHVGYYLEREVFPGNRSYGAEDCRSYLAAGQMSDCEDSPFTGMLEGQNVVYVVIESGEWAAINREYTPTLYAMATQGVSMTQFYGRNKTNISEELGLLGNYHTFTPLDELEREDIPFSLTAVLEQAGYTDRYFHAGQGYLYGRADTFGDLFAFDEAYFLEDMPFLRGYGGKDSFYNFDSDRDMIEGSIEKMTDGEPFFTMIMSITSHGDYSEFLNLGGVDYSDMTEAEKREFSEKCMTKGLEEYYEEITDYPETFVENTFSISDENGDSSKWLKYKRFQAGICDLDAGINALVKALEASGQLDNTAFFFYADHSAFLDDMNYDCKDLNAEERVTDSNELYRIPFFFWSGKTMDLDAEAVPVTGYEAISHDAPAEGISGLQIDKFCSTFDILPTILQLFGYSYNENLYLGTSVFSEETALFASLENGIFDEAFFFGGDLVYDKERKGYDLTAPEVSAFEARYADYYEKSVWLERCYETHCFRGLDLFECGWLKKEKGADGA